MASATGPVAGATVARPVTGAPVSGLKGRLRRWAFVRPSPRRRSLTSRCFVREVPPAPRLRCVGLKPFSNQTPRPRFVCPQNHQRFQYSSATKISSCVGVATAVLSRGATCRRGDLSCATKIICSKINLLALILSCDIFTTKVALRHDSLFRPPVRGRECRAGDQRGREADLAMLTF
jgi:hypothetical protein